MSIRESTFFFDFGKSSIVLTEISPNMDVYSNTLWLGAELFVM